MVSPSSRPQGGFKKYEKREEQVFLCGERPNFFSFYRTPAYPPKAQKSVKRKTGGNPRLSFGVGGAGGNIKECFFFSFCVAIFSLSFFLAGEEKKSTFSLSLSLFAHEEERKNTTFTPHLEQLLLRHGLRQVRRERLDPDLLAGLDLGPHVRLRVAAGADEHHGKARGFARGRDELLHSGGDLAADGGGDGLAVDDGGGRLGRGGFGWGKGKRGEWWWWF